MCSQYRISSNPSSNSSWALFVLNLWKTVACKPLTFIRALNTVHQYRAQSMSYPLVVVNVNNKWYAQESISSHDAITKWSNPSGVTVHFTWSCRLYRLPRIITGICSWRRCWTINLFDIWRHDVSSWSLLRIHSQKVWKLMNYESSIRIQYHLTCWYILKDEQYSTMTR